MKNKNLKKIVGIVLSVVVLLGGCGVSTTTYDKNNETKETIDKGVEEKKPTYKISKNPIKIVELTEERKMQLEEELNYYSTQLKEVENGVPYYELKGEKAIQSYMLITWIGIIKHHLELNHEPYPQAPTWDEDTPLPRPIMTEGSMGRFHIKYNPEIETPSIYFEGIEMIEAPQTR